MGTEFLLSLSRILEHGLNTNSYKFALARALADSELPRGELVPAAWLANKFLELYWPLATEFRVRQSTDPTREPVAYKWALQLAAELRLQPGQPLSAAKAADPAAVRQLVDRLADRGGCLDEVVPRFNRVKKETVRAPLFRPAEDQRSLILAPGANEWIGSHRLPMRQLATGAWVRFTEAFSVAPRLYEKLAGVSATRRSLAGHGRALRQIDDRCFYCGRVGSDSYEVDHFVPWSFVLEDRIWNLVLACGGPTGCNRKKTDGIPSESDLERLNDRNARHLLTPGRANPPDCHPHITEWLQRDLALHVRQLRAAALAEGFPSWRLT
jgi:hypothetical protein